MMSTRLKNLLSKNWLIAHKLESAMQMASAVVSGVMLDIGAGDKPYGGIYSKAISQHIGIDLLDSPLVKDSVDAYGDVHNLPFKDGSFDTVLCTEVLQYTCSPDKAMREAFRVLRNRGQMVVSTTQMWHVTNAPIDRYRFTEYGLGYLASKTGFERCRHLAIGSFWLRIGLKLCYFFEKFKRVRMLKLPVGLLLVLPQLFFLVMDHLFFDKKDPINHFMILRKP